MSVTVTDTRPTASHEFRIYGPLSAVTGEMFREYDRAKAKHGEQTPDGDTTDLNRLATLTEELGEVGRCLTYDQDHAGSLRKELIQVAAMALAWASRLDE